MVNFLSELEVPSPPPTTNDVPSSGVRRRHYMIATGALLAILTLLTLMLYLPHYAVHGDNVRYERAVNAATKLNSFVSDKAKIPADFKEAGISVSDTQNLEYHNVNLASYTFCVTYAHQGVSYTDNPGDVSLFGIIGGYGDGYSGDDYASTTQLMIPAKHKAGKNCQTITPSLPAPQRPNGVASSLATPEQNAKASGLQDSVCSFSKYTTHYYGTIKSVQTADGKPIVPTVKSTLIITVDAKGTSKTGLQTVTVGDSFNVFNTVCTAITHESLQVGDVISVFQDNTDRYAPPAIVDFSRNN